MIALDTNVLVRVIAEEENADTTTRRQREIALALLDSGEPLYVPMTVVLELEWVLRGRYELPRDDVAAILADLVEIENLTVDRAAAVSQAVEWYRRGLDFADALHLAQSALCTRLATFDRDFAKRSTRLGLQPPAGVPKS